MLDHLPDRRLSWLMPDPAPDQGPQDIHDPAFVAALFDRCGPRYRVWAQICSFGFVAVWRRAAVRDLPDPGTPDPIVTDLMAGTGEVWRHVLHRYPGARITAVDISSVMHERALRRLHRSRADRISHLCADALTADLPEGGADVVIATFGLKTLDPGQQQALACQIGRILKPGGCFSLIEASDPVGWWLRPLYRLYMDRILPLVERLLLRGAQDFSMIGTYTRQFGDARHFSRACQDAGLEVRMTRHFFGCATGVVGRRPPADASSAGPA